MKKLFFFILLFSFTASTFIKGDGGSAFIGSIGGGFVGSALGNSITSRRHSGGMARGYQSRIHSLERENDRLRYEIERLKDKIDDLNREFYRKGK